MRGVLRHRAHGRLIAGAGKAGVVDEVPDLVCDGQGRPKAVLSDADRNRVIVVEVAPVIGVR